MKAKTSASIVLLFLITSSCSIIQAETQRGKAGGSVTKGDYVTLQSTESRAIQLSSDSSTDWPTTEILTFDYTVNNPTPITIDFDPTSYEHREFAFDDSAEEPYQITEFEFTTTNKRIGQVTAMFERELIGGITVDSPSMSTGFLVGPDIILTAAHSIYNSDTETLPKEITFLPEDDLQGSGPIVSGGNSCEIVRVYLPSDYYDGYSTGEDWAVCKLEEPIGYAYGWINLSIADWPIGTSVESPFIAPSSIGGGSTSAMKSGAISGETTASWLTTMSTGGGQSGAPYIIENQGEDYAIGIHSYYDDDANCSGGTKISEALYDFVHSFVDGKTYGIELDDIGLTSEYSESEESATSYENHIVNTDVAFRTRSYRTAYNETENAVVLSSIAGSNKENNAFIEFSFRRPITTAYLYMSFWQSPEMESLDKNRDYAVVQYKRGGNDYHWVKALDLLSDETDLPENRATPTKYTLEFDKPVYQLRVYIEYDGTATSSNIDKGRICLFGLSVLEDKDGMPVNWSELPFDPGQWVGDPFQCRAYSYAINNQLKIDSNELFTDHDPGDLEGFMYIVLTRSNIETGMRIDFGIFSETFNKEMVLTRVGKYEMSQQQSYKIYVTFLYHLQQSTPYDYQFYRQNDNGYWSMKEWHLPPVEMDDYSNYIADPSKVEVSDHYEAPGWYYSITPWNRLLEDVV